MCFFQIQSIFSKIYTTYSHSAKLQRELQQIAQNFDTVLKRLGKVFDVRWVASSYRSVKAIVMDYLALHCHFTKLSTETRDATQKATYKGIAGKLSTTEFVQDLNLVRDCLRTLSELSEVLQTRVMDMTLANKHIKWTIGHLKTIKAGIEAGKYI